MNKQNLNRQYHSNTATEYPKHLNEPSHETTICFLQHLKETIQNVLYTSVRDLTISVRQ